MKKIKGSIYCAVLLCAVLLLWGADKEALAQDNESVVIDGVKYYAFNDIYKTAFAYIDDIRGDHLRTELYVRNRVTYKGKTYKVVEFSWGAWENYFVEFFPADYNLWKDNIVIPDKERSYHACLQKITIAKGIQVWGAAYGYDKLERVILENPADLEHAYYNNCPKLKKLYLPAKIRPRGIDIKNCPSLQIKIDKKNKKIKMIGKDIYSKDGKFLYNVVNGKKIYKVRKHVTSIREQAFAGNKAIERLYLSDKNKMFNFILAGMSNLKFIRMGKNVKAVNWLYFRYGAPMKRLDLPKSAQQIYDFAGEEPVGEVKKVYVRAKSLKNGRMRNMPETTTFYVKNEKVKRQMRKYGFRGNIIVKKKMKSFSKVH